MNFYTCSAEAPPAAFSYLGTMTPVEDPRGNPWGTSTNDYGQSTRKSTAARSCGELVSHHPECMGKAGHSDSL